MIGKLKSYGIYAAGIALAVLYAALRIKSSQVDKLKLKAAETKRLALEKQRERANKAIEAATLSELEGKKRLEKVEADIKSGKRYKFGQLRD